MKLLSIICTVHAVSNTVMKCRGGDMDGPCGTHGLCENYTQVFSWENLKERGCLEFLHACMTIILKWVLQKLDVKIRIGFIQLRKGLL